MNAEVKSLLARAFNYFYAISLLCFFVSILILIGNLGMRKNINWNGVLIFYSIVTPFMLISKIISNKLTPNLPTDV